MATISRLPTVVPFMSSAVSPSEAVQGGSSFQILPGSVDERTMGGGAPVCCDDVVRILTVKDKSHPPSWSWNPILRWLCKVAQSSEGPIQTTEFSCVVRGLLRSDEVHIHVGDDDIAADVKRRLIWEPNGDSPACI